MINKKSSNKLYTLLTTGIKNSVDAAAFRMSHFNDYRRYFPQQGINFTSKDFSNEILQCVNFSKVNLRSSRFTNADVTYASFDGANLNGVCFSNAIIKGTTFKNARIKGAWFNDEVKPFIEDMVKTGNPIEHYLQETT